MTEELGVARYEFNKRTGKYDVFARYNPKGLFRKVEEHSLQAWAVKSVTQLHEDDSLRRELLRDTKDWDFVTDDVKEKRQRKPARSAEEIAREKAERKAARVVNFSFEE